MLYPQTNRYRCVIDLSGFWELKTDAEGRGEAAGWINGYSCDAIVGVPGSWNEQLAELGLMNYTGKIWYQKKFSIPHLFNDKRIYLRFGSAGFTTKVWVNGKSAGSYCGSYLPFEFEITGLLDSSGDNILVICVDNSLSHDSIPQGISENDYMEFDKPRELTYPATVFDFFDFGGIQRTICLTIVDASHFTEIALETELTDSHAMIHLVITVSQIKSGMKYEVQIFDADKQLNSSKAEVTNTVEKTTVEFHDYTAWSLINPHLYTLKFRLIHESDVLDEYILETGIRSVQVQEDKILLNGEPVFLKGFGKHEDFPVIGKGLSYPLIVKDLQLLKWMGANSFRTAHYPYAEEIMQMADKIGLLVIDEVPAVSLNFRYVNENTLKNHKHSLKKLIERDRHHPSVIAWSIANEPGIWGEREAVSAEADAYWKELYDLVKQLDSTRPVTLPTCAKWGLDDLAYKYSDFISINRYWGWYEVPGNIEKAGAILNEELLNLHKKYRKPVLVSEFGADTIEGTHATYPQMFTEEYQTALIMKYFDIIESLDFTIGEHIWNFADFRTAQHHRRVVLNKKGVLTRDRQPKSAAFAIRNHWMKIQ